MALPLDTVKRFYALLAAADVPGALSLLHPRIEWREAERSPYFAGTLRGVDAVVAGVLKPMTADFVHLWSVEGDRLRKFMQFTDSTAWREPLLPP